MSNSRQDQGNGQNSRGPKKDNTWWWVAGFAALAIAGGGAGVPGHSGQVQHSPLPQNTI